MHCRRGESLPLQRPNGGDAGCAGFDRAHRPRVGRSAVPPARCASPALGKARARRQAVEHDRAALAVGRRISAGDSAALGGGIARSRPHIQGPRHPLPRLAFHLHSLPCSPVFRALFFRLAGLVLIAVSTAAEPLSRKTDIDFFRDVPSRNLKGLASRSDGRLVAGPTLTEISAAAPADLLWCLEPTNDPTKFLVGTGADGKIYELTLNAAQNAFTSREVVKLDDPQVFA